MGIRSFIGVSASKASRSLIRKAGRGGTNKPGEIAMKFDPKLLRTLAKGVTVIIITGTNGKTTTSRMVETCLKEAGLSYFSNKSGANLLAGITAEFAANSTLSGKCKYEYAVIECDEAAFKTVSEYVDAKYVIVTNVFRDQLDRYGEVTHTLNSIRIGLQNSKNAVVCLNADDSLSASLADDIDDKVLFYGVDTEIYKNRVKEVSDAPYCIKCKTEYKYKYMTYGHLGGFYCPKCGYHRQDPDVSVTEILSTDDEKSVVKMRVGDVEETVTVNLPGGYNIYNAASAACLSKAMGFEPQAAVKALSEFECGFGRMEKFTVGGTDMRMILIKNPAGCNQVLNFVSNIKEEAIFVVALNDNDADGTDISWIWDVDFEKLTGAVDKIVEVWMTGIRAEEMAMRFKYAGFPMDRVKIIFDYEELIKQMISQNRPVYIMPTYTAMLDLREKFSKNFGIKEFWE
ncbi:MAG: Mur ligase family protein [Lachnospiraceae bacterium]|nr:Mur ligase family protein [Lachnospiraceae bacterium]